MISSPKDRSITKQDLIEAGADNITVEGPILWMKDIKLKAGVTPMIGHSELRALIEKYLKEQEIEDYKTKADLNWFLDWVKLQQELREALHKLATWKPQKD